jgi:hypothetical protein
MNTDEKNKYSTTINDFDPDMTREKDKSEVGKEDKSFQRSHHHPIDLHPHRSKLIEHDPYNTKLNQDIDRKNKKLNSYTDSDRRDINIEETPTNRDLHKEHKSSRHQKHVVNREPINLANEDSKKELHPQYKTEVIHDKFTQFPENKGHR